VLASATALIASNDRLREIRSACALAKPPGLLPMEPLAARVWGPEDRSVDSERTIVARLAADTPRPTPPPSRWRSTVGAGAGPWNICSALKIR